VTGRTDPRPLLLVLCSMRRELREYLLASLSGAYRVHLLVSSEPTWESRYIGGSTVVASTLDDGLLIDAATELSKVEPIAGVLTWDESRTPQAASLTEALRLPGPSRAAVGRCRDKHQTRTALAAANVGQPRSVKADTVAQALSAAQQFGYPVVVKPSTLAVSRGVVKVDNPEQLREQFEVVTTLKVRELPDYRVQALVEEYVDGEEISIDCAVFDGDITMLCLARKQTGYPPYFIEVGHMVDATDPLLGDPTLAALLRQAHAALGFDHGVTHTEIRLTRSGLKVIEVNARLGGDMIPYLGLRATGVDVALAAAAIACGHPPTAFANQRLVAGVRFFNVDDGGTIDSIHFDESARAPATDLLTVLAGPGHYAPAPTTDPVHCRVAFATSVGASQEDCLHALDAAEKGLRITLRATPSPSGAPS
jgi:biotin carboxylase